MTIQLRLSEEWFLSVLGMLYVVYFYLYCKQGSSLLYHLPRSWFWRYCYIRWA